MIRMDLGSSRYHSEFSRERHRRAGMSLVSAAIRIAAPYPKIESFESYLFIGPHPDDIEIGAGATVHRLSDMGRKIVFLICTDGRFGDGASKGIKGDELAAVRKEEARASAERLGVKDVRFLNLRDGGGYKTEELEKGIAEVIADTRPDIIFGPDPSPRNECHTDHLNVGLALKKTGCFAPYSGVMQNLYGTESAPVKAIAFYMTARPNRFVKTGKYLKDQLSAIFECHLSQYPPGSSEAEALRLYLKMRSLQYGIRTLSKGAEGFYVIGQTHMHCLPEADR